MTAQAIQGAVDVLGQFWHLTKPRVVSLIVFTAVIGMLLAAPTAPPMVPMLYGTVEVHHDLQSARYLAMGLRNDQPKVYEKIKRDRADFTPAGLRGVERVARFDQNIVSHFGVLSGLKHRGCGGW